MFKFMRQFFVMISSTMARDFTVSVFQPVAVFSFFGFYWVFNIFLVQYTITVLRTGSGWDSNSSGLC